MKRDYNRVEAAVFNDHHNLWYTINCNTDLIDSIDLSNRCTYDDFGRVITAKQNDMYYDFTYHEDGGLSIHTILKDGGECWTRHDNQGRAVSYLDSNGYEEYYTYDENGNREVTGPFNNVLR